METIVEPWLHRHRTPVRRRWIAGARFCNAAIFHHLQEYIKAYVPVGAPEEDLVRSLTDSKFRLKNITALERALLIRPETVERDAYDDTLKELRCTATYGNRTQRTIEKTRAALKEMHPAPRGTLQNRPMRDTSKPANGNRQDEFFIPGYGR